MAVVLLGVLVSFHELGHFLAGRGKGVYVHEFAIGMGPTLFSRQGEETKYSLRLIPVGGFTKFAGEEGPDRDEDAAIPKDRLLNAQSAGRRAWIVFAGPLANLLIASLAFFAVFSFVGLNRPTNALGEVMAGYPAEKAGLLPGDVVVSVDGVPTPTWEAMTQAIKPKVGQLLTIVVSRGNEEIPVSLTPIDVSGVGVIGIRPTFVVERLGLMRGLYEGIKETLIVSLVWVRGIFSMLVGRIAPEVTGPVGITQILGEAARTGIGELIYLFGALSANLGLINLMPIPALDGSRLVFAGVEAVRGRPIDPEKESFVHFIGFFLLMALFVVITYKDILRLIR